MSVATRDLDALLGRERERLLAQFHRVPAERRAAPTADGRWCAAEIVGHVARVESGVARMLGAGATMPRTAGAEELAAAAIDERKVRAVRDRSTRLEAPERTHPRDVLTADAALEQLAQSRAALLAAFHSADPAVLDGIIFPHPFIGPLTLRAWVELVAHHDARHAEQMGELAAAL